MIKYSLLLLSILLYTTSLFVRCLSSGSAGNLFPSEYSGWEVLKFGFYGITFMQFAWIANPFYFGGLVLSFSRINKMTLILSVIASLFALNTFTWKYDLYSGAYLWMGSIFTLTALQVLYIKRLIK